MIRITRRSVPGTLALFCLSLPPATALAQTASIPHIVIYANQTPEEAPKVGAAVTVLTGDQLREKGITTVADALRTVPGVAVNQSGGPGTLTQVRVRGDDARNVMVLIDGVEVNRIDGTGFDFAGFSTEDVERIEVIRGPQSGLYGADALAGVISIVTRSGKGLKGIVFNADAEGGTSDTYRAGFNLRGGNGPVYGSLTVSDAASRGYNISRFGSELDGFRALTTTAKGGVDLMPNLNVEGVIRYTNRATDSDPQDFNFPPGPTFGFVVDGPGQTTYSGVAARVGATFKLFDNHWIQSADVKLLKDNTTGFDAGPAPTFGAEGTRQTLDYKSTFLFDTGIAGGEHHSVTVLVDNRRDHFVQLFDPTQYDKQRTGLAGEYVIDLPTLTTISAALRHDWNSAFADVDTWRLALSQRIPLTATRLHASAGKGVTDPNIFALLGSQFNLPNPGLLPEQSIGWDAGIEQSFLDGRVVADVTYFTSDFTNKVELSFDAALGNFIYVNGTGIAHRRGVEVSGRFGIFDWLSANASYTYTNATDSNGDQEVRRPPHAGSIEATARFLDNRAKATVGVDYNGVMKDFFFTPVGTTFVDLPAATVVRALVSYDINKWVTAYVRGENIFNTQYEEVFSYRAPGVGVFAGLKGRFGND